MTNIKKIIVVGGTGFTGTQVLKQLENIENIEVTCLVRSHNKTVLWSGKNPLKIVIGDLDDAASLEVAFKGQDSLIFVASMGFGQMQNVVKACELNNVKRAVFTSSTAIYTQLPAQSKDGREMGEKHVVQSGISWTILRPTMIYGRKGDRNVERLIRNLKRFPVFFIPGSGEALQQPIFVDDVAKATIQSLNTEKTICMAYNISGKNSLTFNELVQTTSLALNRNVRIIHLPLWPMRLLIKFYNFLTKKPKITEEQLLRLNENKAFDHKEAVQDFNFTPLSFHEGIRALVTEIS